MKKPLKTLTFFLSAITLILTGCTGNDSRNRTPAPVVTPGQHTPKPVAPITINKPIVTPVVPQAEIKSEPMVTPPEPVTNTIEAITPTLSNAELQIEQQRVTQQQQVLRKVVILLPDHPSLGDVNRDIEKGIRAAHQQRPHNTNLQLIFVHDPLPAEQLLNKAKSFSPDWIIGPLTKTDIQAIAGQLDKQQILLNRLDTATVALQLGLPVEDETTQLLKSLANNTQPIAVVASNDAIEQRLLANLQQQASAQNIPVLTINVDKQNADISLWLENEGGLSKSRQRIQRMEKLLRTKLEMPAQARTDLQALILLGNGRQAHSFMPAVQYNQINWPILATSRLLPTRKGDKFNEPDFEGVRVLTPPYLISATGPETPFEALGWDSYQLLGNPNAINVAGMTGKLILNANNQLLRQLTWQKIHQSQLNNIKLR
jgi:hypothetical protein